MAKEEIIGVVKPYPVGRHPDSLVIVIPKEIRERLRIRSREKFHVKIDDTGRIIYERLEGNNTVVSYSGDVDSHDRERSC
jgi:bifunctional DNA-binding transcriptional regulator/antitoxin component of YhaV-PrlF toxin-antitoxin module